MTGAKTTAAQSGHEENHHAATCVAFAPHLAQKGYIGRSD
jgi:hypothetical protein